MLRKALHTLFFGNYFYGLCVVLLSIESAIQSGTNILPFHGYLAIFCATVAFYRFAYLQSPGDNERGQWYLQHRNAIKTMQWVLVIAAVIAGTFFLLHSLPELSGFSYILLLSFPVTAVFYYSIFFPRTIPFHIRHASWLKPFIIGYVWAGIITAYPILLAETKPGTSFSALPVFLFLKNWLFISILAILFDIKDYAADNNAELKTFVVRKGLTKTILTIVLPMTGLGWLLIAWNALRLGITPERVLINAIPFGLLIIAALSLLQRKPILYYLAVIDGLLLVKAICGIIAFTII